MERILNTFAIVRWKRLVPKSHWTFSELKDEICMWQYLPPSTEKRNLSDYETNAIKQKLPIHIFYGF